MMTRPKLAYRSGEPQCGSLAPPVEGQARVGHQFVGGQFRRLLSGQDRGDNVGGEESQPNNDDSGVDLTTCQIRLSRPMECERR